MPASPHATVHRRTVAAPADRVFPLIADATRWPAIFEPSVALRHLATGENEERFQIWALVNGAISTWTSHRTIDRSGRCVRFRQERSRPPVTGMSGGWTVRANGLDRCEVELRHEFTLDAVAADSQAGFRRAVDANSERELAALARVAELGDRLDHALFSFEDAQTVAAPAEAVYDFIARADDWPKHLPHVARVSLREDPPGIQELELETVTPDRAAHVTRSFRVCSPPEWIAYKQVVLPDLLWGHSGVWSFVTNDDGSCTASSRHTVLLHPAAVAGTWGASTPLPQAQVRVRELLGANSRTTLQAAVDHAARGPSGESGG